MVPYWEDAIAPDLATKGSVSVAAHGNSLRALVKYLKGLSDEAIIEAVEIPTGVPWLFRLADDLTVLEDRLLGDPAEIEAAMEATAKQASSRLVGLRSRPKEHIDRWGRLKSPDHHRTAAPNFP